MSKVDNREWYQIGYEAAKQELKREPLSIQEIYDLDKYSHQPFEIYRDLLKKALDFMLDVGANLNPLFKEINDNLLAQPEQENLELVRKLGFEAGYLLAIKECSKTLSAYLV